MSRGPVAARVVPVDLYQTMHAAFRWHVPEFFNIAQACSRRWAETRPRAVAVRWQHESGESASFTYGELQRAADRLSGALRAMGIERGDRVAIVMPQRFETAVAYMAVLQLGAVATPLSMLFGPDALTYRLNHSGARVAIVDEGAVGNLLRARPECPELIESSVNHDNR